MPTEWTHWPDASYRPQVYMIDRTSRRAGRVIAVRPVTGWTPPLARGAAIVASSAQFTWTEHAWKYRSSVSSTGDRRTPKLRIRYAIDRLRSPVDRSDMNTSMLTLGFSPR